MDTKDETYYLYELINEKPVSPFGEALYKICRRFGITQPLLEKYAEAEYALMEAEGKIAVQSSMKQQVISRVVTGLQRTSYLQTFIWLKVIKQHYENEKVIEYFRNKGLEMPLFTEEIEDELWALSGHQSPKSVKRAVDYFSSFDPVPRRLPHAMSNLPQTDPRLQTPQPTRREDRNTDALDYRGIKELQ